MPREVRLSAAIFRCALQAACALALGCFQARADTMPVLEVGAATSCSTWTWARRHQPAASDLQDWALGYFSGEETGASGSFVIGSSDDTLFSALDTQCRIEPKDSITNAVDTLVAGIKQAP